MYPPSEESVAQGSCSPTWGFPAISPHLQHDDNVHVVISEYLLIHARSSLYSAQFDSGLMHVT